MRSISFTFWLLLSFRALFTEAQVPNLLGSNCQNTSQQQQPLSSAYQTNLERILTWVSSDAYKGKVYNYRSIGITSSVYGLYDCRGDVVGYFCQFCVSNAAREAPRLCPNSVSAMVWYDYCILRYSNENFFGKVLTNPIWYVLGTKNIFNKTEIQKVGATCTTIGAFTSGTSELGTT
ncbi:cysteine-rich receptor-like protein kinase 10 [Cajanus cajan]|uniref:Cysteine-rich receptor-like protein kinase 25 n=1 Tax=Cajanus cajan TaxID=3821 RepID=A0A151QVQ2_CAJCA|nr:cysteine-rich receptor-like protein kinase 10 [Cajanus cajan]KYP34447.1 Cysteine-rich receptor-like protein kinase 25 [Cajanus cajan]